MQLAVPLLLLTLLFLFLLTMSLIPPTSSGCVINLVPEQPRTNIDYMRKALAEAKKCKSVPTAYNVGAILLSQTGAVLSTGFSRELPGNTHAEECCLLKLSSLGVARGGTMYTTMEPCSERLSGKMSCTDKIIKAELSRVVIAVKEPDIFVNKCVGVERLREHDLDVVVLDGLECAALAPNLHLLASDNVDRENKDDSDSEEETREEEDTGEEETGAREKND